VGYCGTDMLWIWVINTFSQLAFFLLTPLVCFRNILIYMVKLTLACSDVYPLHDCSFAVSHGIVSFL